MKYLFALFGAATVAIALYNATSPDPSPSTPLMRAGTLLLVLTIVTGLAAAIEAAKKPARTNRNHRNTDK